MQSSTDAKILSLLRHDNELAKQENANKDPVLNSTMRDYLASEVSEDICRRYIFPEDVIFAHDEGIIHVHDMGYVSGPITNCELVNLEDMLQNGTVITDTLIEKPHSFSTACNIATQIVAQVASNTYGGQTISLAHLAPFVDVSRQKYRKEIREEMKAIGEQLDEDKLNQMAEMRVRREVDSQLVILRDKFMFYKYMKSCNLPVPEVFAIWKKGKLYDVDFNEIEWRQLESRKDYFVKSIDGECASFVKHVSDFDELTKIKTKFEKEGAYIFQEKVIQSDEMNVLNPNALNTYRIVTINKDGKTYLLTALLRVGTKKTGNVDNWAAGGLAIGISDTGNLKEYGFYKPIYGTKIDVHPDTGIKFSEFHAPEYKQAVELACRAHKTLYGIRAIGWDVAISDHGPVFIEGNDNWEISLNQACDRPLRKEWEEVIS